MGQTMNKEKPILFKPEMVRAILDGKKTQTRRTNGLDQINENPNQWEIEGRIVCSGDSRDVGKYSFTEKDGDGFVYLKCPYGEVGDRLWVREPWGEDYTSSCIVTVGQNQQNIPKATIVYKADGHAMSSVGTGWKPSIHMPRVACRLVLEVVDARVERVQGITEEDAMMEGVSMQAGETDMRWNPAQAFQYLWDSIHSKDGYEWEKNPWVWVITFRRIEQVAG